MVEYLERNERRAETSVVNAMAYTDRSAALADLLAPGFFGPTSRIDLDDIVLLRASDGTAWAECVGFDHSTGKKRPVLAPFRTEVSEPAPQRRKAA